ncbi:MAG: PAS domain S-box protein, partial [Bacteroidetes bacterium]|nr:PAS domain S-box protein [Bacteroidota bacterium]
AGKKTKRRARKPRTGNPHPRNARFDRFELLSRQTGQLVYDYNVSTGRIDWFGSIHELTGYSDAEFQETDLSRWESLIHPEDRPRVLAQLTNVLESGGQYLVQYRFLTKSGLYRYFEDCGFVLKRQKQPDRMIGAMSDITERVHAENSIRSSEAAFKILIQNLPVGLLVLNGLGHVQLCNATVLSMLRVQESDLLNRSFAEMPWKAIREDGSEVNMSELPIAESLRRKRPIRDVIIGLEGIRKRPMWFLVHVTPLLDSTGNFGSLLCTLSDISALRETQKALARSREHLGELHLLHSEILESAAEGIVVYDRELRYRLWNHSMETLTGLRSSQVLGRRASDVFPHLQTAGLLDLIKKTLEGQPCVAPDFQYEDTAGVMHWVSSSYSPHRSVSGEVIGVIAMIRDVTQRHIAEQAFHESQQLMSTIAGSTPDLLYVYDLQHGNITYTNRSLAEYLGFHDPNQTVEIAPSPRWKHDTAELMVTSESRFLDKDGRWRWFLSREKVFRKSPVGEPIQIIGSMREITQEKEKEIALQESESHYRSIFESTTNGLFIIDRRGKIVDANSAGLAMHSYTASELLGRPFQDLLDGADSHFLEKVFVLAEKDVASAMEGSNIRKDGSSFPVELKGNRFQSKERILYLLVITDISERKQAEQKLIQAQKMESIGRIAGGVAHDINNVLAVILPTAQMIRNEDGAGEKLREFADVIINSAQRSSDMVKQLLVFSRQTPTRMSWLNVNDLMADMLKMLSRLLEKNIQIETDLEDSLPFVEADTTQLHQVLLNLAVNARDAMPNGGRLKLQTRVLE